MPTGHSAYLTAESKGKRKKIVIVAVTFVFFLILIAFSLSIRVVTNELFAFSEVLKNLKLFFSYSFANVFNLEQRFVLKGLIKESENYYEVVSRLKLTFMTLIAGAVLSLAGAIFQGAFKNPMAAPTMLGVTNGVSLGILVLVLKFGVNALVMVKEKYIYCYGFSMFFLVIILLVGRFVGKERNSVTDMFFVGAIISQITSVFITFYRYQLEDDALLVMQQMSNGIYINVDDMSIMILIAVVGISIVPVYLTRFSFNAACFDNDESIVLGINPSLMRLIMLVAGTLMTTASMIHLGSVGMVSLVVPHMVRYIFGSDFRKIFWGTLVYGSMLLLICRDITEMTIWGAANMLPMSTVVSIITTPLFILVLLRNKRGWE